MEADKPFRPLTLAQVQEITGCPTELLDRWASLLGMQEGSGRCGLDYVQAYAVFVGARFVKEGSGQDRAEEVMSAVVGFGLEALLREFAQGCNFPVVASQWEGGAPVLVMAPSSGPGSVVGQRLRLDRLHKEFRAELRKLFPELKGD